MSITPLIQCPGLTAGNWDQVHAQVQASLDVLSHEVRSRCPSVFVRRGGNTSGRVWYLYSYREFNLSEDDSEVEDTVAGLTFSPEGARIRIQADIGGAATGIIDYEAPERLVPADLSAVLTAAGELSDELIQRADVVVTAISERRPPPNYRQPWK